MLAKFRSEEFDEYLRREFEASGSLLSPDNLEEMNGKRCPICGVYPSFWYNGLGCTYYHLFLGMRGFLESDGLLDMSRTCNHLDEKPEKFNREWEQVCEDMVPPANIATYFAQMKANAIIFRSEYLQKYGASGYYPRGIEDEWMEDQEVAEIVNGHRARHGGGE